MKSLFVTQEFAPFFSEGGLGLTSAALPASLDALHGIRHDLVMPYYPWLVNRLSLGTEQVSALTERQIAGHRSAATVHRLLDHDHNGNIFLIRADSWYDRAAIYRDDRYLPFPDEAARSAFFGSCVADWLAADRRSYSLVHGNDWQSGSVLAHLRDRYPSLPLLLTIHNGFYTGELLRDELLGLGLPAGQVGLLLQHEPDRPSLLLAGILAADAVVTCSPGYAQELLEQTSDTPLGSALHRAEPTGIVFGVDGELWHPGAIGRSTLPFDASNVDAGKQLNKQELQKRLRLTQDDSVPLIGVCSRVVPEKGSDLLLEALAPLLVRGSAQLVLVGPAEDALRTTLHLLGERAVGNLSYIPHFDQDIAWLTYAGADLTVMPSRVEPCGLNQLIAYRYGTLPVVNPVGGLRDTVTDVRSDPTGGGGFLIPELSAEAVRATVLDAMEWMKQPGELTETRRRVMEQDWSWTRTAGEYARIHLALTERAA
ncbi:glycogen/starch synthase (plasmid) [Streptomyces sp. NBC_00715]|uniref:glycogen synthase n=1 Tax=Streptomyces sp. NBC_00715 TaxID=2975811 RepID=UPI002F911CE0